MSPILPQYQRLANHDEEVFDSWRKSPVAKDGEDAQLPTYPPREGSGSGSGSGQSIVTFIFVPRYPVKGKKESVLGVMGRDKEETTAMVQQAFPILNEYPPQRIEFLSPENKDAKIEGEGWSRILDATWDRLYRESPERLKVQVADGPGDQQARKWKEIRNSALLMSGFLSPFIVLIIVLATLEYKGMIQ